MALLRKPKPKDEDFDEELDDEPRKKIRRKDFRDLNPENKKKRKEPKKPWGRKERLLVLILLLLTAGYSAFLLISSSGWEFHGLPRLNLPTFSDLNIWSEKTYVIENEKQENSTEINLDEDLKIDLNTETQNI